MESISCHITPLVINSQGADTHTNTHTHAHTHTHIHTHTHTHTHTHKQISTHTIRMESILRNQAY